MALNMRVHEYEERQTPGGKQTVLTKFTPYLMFNKENDRVFLQRGIVYERGGKKLKQIPAWVFAQMKASNTKALEAVGFTKEHIAKLEAGAPPPEDPPEPLPATVTEAVPVNRALTSEETDDMDFPALKAYANQRGITASSRTDLLAKLREAGYVH